MARDTAEIERMRAVYTFRSNYGVSYDNVVFPWKNIRQYTGTTTPGFKNMTARQRAKLPVNPYNVLYERRSGTQYTDESTDRYGNRTVTTWSTMVVLLPSPSVEHLSDAYTKARSRLATDMNKLHVNLAQAMGERKQTMNLIVSNLERVVALARAIKHADFTYLTRNYNKVTRKWQVAVEKVPMDKRLSMFWLEYQYGWKPLLQDIYGAQALLQAHINGDRWHSKSIGEGTAKRHSMSVDTYANVDKIEKTTTKLCVRYGLSSADRAALSSAGMDNPALLAWELLPYSFVVDWFLPVGNYLEALNAFAGFTFVDGWRSDRSKLIYTEDRNKTLYYGGGVQKTNGWGVTSNGRYTRAPLSGFPGIGFPEFKNPIGGDPITRFATAYSLLRVLFK